MEGYVEVNGAKIERRYLEESVLEARAANWSPRKVPDEAEHVHCMICSVAMRSGDEALQSQSGWLCDYCHSRFLR